jgi:hypothetical protein
VSDGSINALNLVLAAGLAACRACERRSGEEPKGSAFVARAGRLAADAP